jgi:hypothetical protein
MLGNFDGATAFDDLPFETRPPHTGNPWFVPAPLCWLRLAERLGWLRGSVLEMLINQPMTDRPRLFLGCILLVEQNSR